MGTTGCFPPDEGQVPDLNRIYFPTGLALSPVEGADSCNAPTTAKHRWLYVANSDFDLQFNAGTVQVFDLDLVDEVIKAMNVGAEKPEDRCPEVTMFGNRFGGQKSEAEQFVAPGLCQPVATQPLNPVTVKIGAFATDIRYLKRPAGTNGTSDMLVVPIRGDRTLHWIDTDPTQAGPLLDCGVDENGDCDADHRRGNEPAAENTRNAELPREPFGVAADQRGEAIVTTHQSTGQLALFVNDWSQSAPAQKGPVLQFVLTDPNNIPVGAVGVVSIPEPDVSLALRGTDSPTFYEPGYYATFRNSAQVSLLRYFSDEGDFSTPTSPGRAFLEFAGTTPIRTNSQGFDSRGIAVDSSKRHECECACDQNPGPSDCRNSCVDTETKEDKALCDPSAVPPGQCAPYVQCLRACARTPLGVFVSNRTPATLIVGRTLSNSSATSSDDDLAFDKNESVTAGPSRVVIGRVRVPDGKGGTRVEGRVFRRYR